MPLVSELLRLPSLRKTPLLKRVKNWKESARAVKTKEASGGDGKSPNVFALKP